MDTEKTTARHKLIDFIDAVIADDATAQKAAFTQYTEDKTKEILQTVQEGDVKVTKISPDDVNVTDRVKLDVNSVMVDGKKVGTIEERDITKNGSKNNTVFIALDGTETQIHGTAFSDLMEFIKTNYLETT